MRMSMPQQIDRDAAREIQILLAALAIEIDALAAHRTHGRTGINGHERRYGHECPLCGWSASEKGDHARSPLRGRYSEGPGAASIDARPAAAKSSSSRSSSSQRSSARTRVL